MFIFSNGEYSDYEVCTLCRATEDINIKIVKRQYFAKFPNDKENYCFSHDAFMKWLIVDKKLAEELDYTNFHLGSYGEADFELRHLQNEYKKIMD